MSQARYIVGDALEVMATLEPGSVDLVMTSPPFLALRSYLPADHELKAKEIGSEPTPGAFIDRMLNVVEACGRVLAPHGSLVFELGDTYAGGGGGGEDGQWGRYADGDVAQRKGGQGGSPAARARKASGWPLDKSKTLIPQLFAVALAYGFNPLTGRQTEPWRVRNTVAWCRPNPPVGRDGDKFRPATSFLTVACKARDRYWDGDAVRTPVRHPEAQASHLTGKDVERRGTLKPYTGDMSAGAPLLDWWNIPTEPYPGAHYATYPAALVVPVVKAMCPQRVCRTCGRPSRRITEASPEYQAQRDAYVARRAETHNGSDASNPHRGTVGRNNKGLGEPTNGQNAQREIETVGWTECKCFPYCTADPNPYIQVSKWRPGLVLDPFAGSGTTLQVATGHGMDAIGIDLDARNAQLAVERIGGLFLTVEHFNTEAACASVLVREQE